MGANGWHPGWLADQLPRVMAEDDFIRRFLGPFEEVAGDIRARVAGFEHHLDVGLAAPGFVRWMGSWLGLALDPSLSEEHQRDLVRAAGRLFSMRGTREGLKGILEAFTRSTVEVADGGGVFREGAAPDRPKIITIRVEDTGGLAESQLLELIRSEVPADAAFELRVGRRRVKEESAPQEDLATTLQMPVVVTLPEPSPETTQPPAPPPPAPPEMTAPPPPPTPSAPPAADGHEEDGPARHDHGGGPTTPGRR